MRVFAWCVAAALAVAGTQANAAWNVAKSQHFIIYANESESELRDYAQKLERFDQAVRYFFQMPDPKLGESERVTIFVVPDVEAVQKLEGSYSVAGFYHTTAGGSFAFVPKTTNYIVQGMSGGVGTFHSEMSPQEIFFHEYTHHLQLQESQVSLPLWVSEGYAEFFATAEINKDGSVTIGKFPTYRAWGMHDRDSITMEQIVGETFGDRVEAYKLDTLYARAWLLTHYLMMTDSRKGQLGRYVAAINRGVPAPEAGKQAFGDLKELDRAVDAYLAPHQLLAFTVAANVLKVGDVSIHALSPGEGAIMDVKMRLKSGANGQDPAEIARDARAVAANFTNDPDVQSTLAEAEFDAKNYSAAEAAADHALSARPTDIDALIYKGRVQMAEARANPKAADWDGVRSWFMKANKVDTENAEPLALFYESYPEAGQSPTQNAQDALLYALDLAPGDEQLRMDATGLLIAENKLDEAKAMIAPIAYQPHMKPELRELASKIMAALGSGDTKRAIALMAQGPTADSAKKR